MGSYFYLLSSFPSLDLSSLPDQWGTWVVKEVIDLNVSEKDKQKVKKLYAWLDLLNIKCIFQEEAIDSRGNLDEEQLDHALLHQEYFPVYVFDFLQKYDSFELRLKNFPELLAQFLREQEANTQGFLRDWWIFERQLRLVLLAIRAKEAGRGFVQELQFEDLLDPFVIEIMVQKDADRYEPPGEFKDLHEALIACAQDPAEKNKVIAEYRFKKAQDMAPLQTFCLDALLLYLVQLMTIEDWHGLSKEKGENVLGTFTKRGQ